MAASPPPPALLPDWSDLQRDAMELIIRLLEIQDALAAAAVCTTWRAAAAAALGRALTPRSVHWFVSEDCWSPGRRDGARLHDFLSRRSFRSTVPGVPAGDRTWRICGSSHGWLVVEHVPYHSGSLSLVNLFNGAHIPLPPAPRTSYFSRKAVISGDPSRSGDHYAVMLITDQEIGESVCSISFVLSGDQCWRHKEGSYSISGCISHQGKFITVEEQGRIAEWDIGSMSHSKNPPKERMIFRFPISDGSSQGDLSLLAAPWGDLLLVHRWGSEAAVFTVDVLKKTIETRTSLQGHMMIKGIMSCSLISIEMNPALVSDSILFVKPFQFVDTQGASLFLGMYNMTSQTFEPLPMMLEPLVFPRLCTSWIIFPSNGGFDSSSTNEGGSEDPNGSGSDLDNFVREKERKQ